MLKLDSGESVEIDKGVVDLIKLMNSIPGIETKGSCQGEDPNYGYVQFMPDGTEGKVHASVYFMYHILKNMHGAWVLHRHVMGEYQESTGSEHPEAHKFKFTTELGNAEVYEISARDELVSVRRSRGSGTGSRCARDEQGRNCRRQPQGSCSQREGPGPPGAGRWHH